MEALTESMASKSDLLQAAVTAYCQSDIKSSQGLFLQAIEKLPSVWGAWTGYVLSSLDSSKASEALQRLAEPVLNSETCHDLARALLLLLLGRTNAMRRVLDQARYPKQCELVKRTLDAKFLAAIGDLHAAKEVAEEILEESPADPFILRYLDALFEMANSWEDRRRVWDIVSRKKSELLETDIYGPIVVAVARIGAALDPKRAFSKERQLYEIHLVTRDFSENVSVFEIAATELFDLKEWDLVQRIQDIILRKVSTAPVLDIQALLATARENKNECSRLRLELVRREPENVVSYLRIVDDLLQRGNPQDAMTLCEEGLTNCGRETALLVTTAHVALTMDNQRQTADLLEEALESGNLAGAKLAMAAGFAMSIDNSELCRRILQARRPGNRQASVTAAIIAMREGREEEVVGELVEAYEEDEDLEQNIPKEIIVSLVERLKEQGGDDFPATLIRHLGVTLAYNQRLSDGVELIRLAIERGDKSKEAYQHAIQISLQEKDYTDAMALAQRAAQSHSLSHETLIYLFRALLSLGDTGQVRSLAENLRKIPDLADELLPAIAEVYAKFFDDKNEALTMLEERCGPDSSLELHDNLAQWLAEAKYYARSAELCKRALAKHAGNARLLGRLSLALEQLGRAKESLEYCKQCLDADPAFEWALRKMVRHRTAMFEFNRAREVYERAVQASPESKSIRSDYAEFLVEAFNDPMPAAKQIEHALLSDPENAALQQKLERYQSAARGIEKAFGPTALSWFTDNKERLQLFVSRLVTRLGDRMLACAYLPPKKAGKDEDGSDPSNKVADKNQQQELPRIFILFSDVDADDTNIESEIATRDSIVREELSKNDLPDSFTSTHWSGLWRSCFDGDYELFESIEVGFVLHDRGYLVGLRHLWRHRQKILGKFEKYIAAYVVAGSFVRGDARDDSDIDAWVVIDDTDVKKMTRSDLDYQIRVIIERMGKESAEELEIKDRLHIQTYLLTNYWSALRDASPVITTFLMDGRPLYDRGIFTAWRILHEDGRLAPPREVISERLREARKAFEKVKGGLFALAEQALYNPMLTAGQGVLLAYGEQPPTPSKTVEALKKLGIMSEEEVSCLKEIISLIERCKHGGLDSISMGSIDRIAEKSSKFLSAAESAVESVYAQARGKDLSREELVKQYEYCFRELMTLSNMAPDDINEVDTDLVQVLGRKGILDPMTVFVYRNLLDLNGVDRTVTPNASSQTILELARKQLSELQRIVERLHRKRVSRNSVFFTYGEDKRGEIVRFADFLYIIHDVGALSESAVCRISMWEDDYGAVYSSTIDEYRLAQRKELSDDSSSSLVLTESILRLVKLAVGDDPKIDMSV